MQGTKDIFDAFVKLHAAVSEEVSNEDYSQRQAKTLATIDAAFVALELLCTDVRRIANALEVSNSMLAANSIEAMKAQEVMQKLTAEELEQLAKGTLPING